jgi:hypothetical protein
MSENTSTYRLTVPAKLKKQLDKAAALLDLNDWIDADNMGSDLVIKYAESHVKGKTSVLFCTPDVASCVKNNPAFFEALCQEGVIEWLTPFVLGKSTTRPEKGQ